MNEPVLGIVGGVGPLATAYFMKMLVEKSPAATDQDNMPMIVFNDPQIPDRTSYILDHKQENPTPELVSVARRLERAGADYIAIPCNTAHYFYDAINHAVSVPVLNIMEETARHLSHAVGRGGAVGLMATSGTIQSKVFDDYLGRHGMTVHVPPEEDQLIVNDLIYGCVKANRRYDPKVFLGVAERLHARGCAAVIVGCTELSVIYQKLEDKPIYLFDSLDILAERCCAYYYTRQAKGVLPAERR